MLPETEQWRPDLSTAKCLGVPAPRTLRERRARTPHGRANAARERRANTAHEMPFSVPISHLWNGKWHLRFRSDEASCTVPWGLMRLPLAT